MNSPKIQSNIMNNQSAIEKGTGDFVSQQPQPENTMNHKIIPSCLALINHAATLLLRARSVNRAVIAAVSCLALSGLSAFKANAAEEWVTNPGGASVYFANFEDETFGTLITVGSNDLSVTGMGLWDVWLDGFVTSHEMGIWSNGVLIASVTMPAGTVAQFDGVYEWRWVTLPAPVTLLAGQTYTIGAQFFNGGGVHANADEWVGSASVTPGLIFSTNFATADFGVNPNLMRAFSTTWPTEPVNPAGGSDVLYSVNIKYDVLAPPGSPVITNQPSATTVAQGGTTHFTVGVSNAAGVTYVWTRNGNTVVNGGEFSGATTATLTITGASTNDVGQYQVQVSNVTGSIFSVTVPLAINGLNVFPTVVLYGTIGNTYEVDRAPTVTGPWTPFSTNTLTVWPQYITDPTLPISTSQFYRQVFLY
ncbi:MAG: immunoglobulin domain-containing protein [Verrucomicrobiales bacterium]|nr:immunoglobulin domain-containing protein [Verrucomicrobiales bacterium]